jgi:hypothetical protein
VTPEKPLTEGAGSGDLYDLYGVVDSDGRSIPEQEEELKLGGPECLKGEADDSGVVESSMAEIEASVGGEREEEEGKMKGEVKEGGQGMEVGDEDRTEEDGEEKADREGAEGDIEMLDREGDGRTEAAVGERIGEGLGEEGEGMEEGGEKEDIGLAIYPEEEVEKVVQCLQALKKSLEQAEQSTVSPTLTMVFNTPVLWLER